PVLLPRPRVVGGLAGREGAGERLVVHPRHHQHGAGGPLLHDGGEQTVVVALQPGGDRRIQDVAAHRTVIPSARIASLTSPIVSSRKWKTLAASTASAPACTAGAK